LADTRRRRGALRIRTFRLRIGPIAQIQAVTERHPKSEKQFLPAENTPFPSRHLWRIVLL
jgi:hypothetical protein